MQEQQQQANAINPDLVCQQALQARMATYEAKEYFETILKGYNDQVAALIKLVALMRARMAELEEQVKQRREGAGSAKK
jgi:uncharacterized coiled-coil protein SlyX